MWGHYSFDTRGAWYACRVLCIVLLMVIATKYGVARASERLSQGASVASVSVPTPAPVIQPKALETREIPIPTIAAEAYIVADVSTGQVIASRNADTDLPIASITKLMTALVATEELPPESLLTITTADRSRTEGTPGRVPANATYETRDLIYPLLMESNNSVAFALARSHSRFIERMNERASDIGMLSTRYVEPSGLSPENRASARDLLALLRYLHSQRPDLLAVTKTPAYQLISSKGRGLDVPNFNVFLADEAFAGGKTGYTDDANQTMAALFTDGDITFAIIVLGTKDRKADIDALREWLGNALIR